MVKFRGTVFSCWLLQIKIINSNSKFGRLMRQSKAIQILLQHGIKILCFLLLVDVFLMNNSNAQAAENQILNYKIIDVYSGNPIVAEPDAQTGQLVNLTKADKNINLRVIVDSCDINRLSLVKYRFYFANNNQVLIPDWSPYPVKDLNALNGIDKKLVIEAQSADGTIFSTSFQIKGPVRLINSWLMILSIVAGIILIVLIVYFWFDYQVTLDKHNLEQEINSRTNELIEQKTKYEELLTNYLPKEDFEKLKEKNRDKTIRYKMVTVLFSNVLGFSKIADQENAEQLIDDVDRFFFHFDEVVQRLHIEKIKSVGDVYMCAGGIPQKNRTNPIEVVLAAFEMYQYMQDLKVQYQQMNQEIWDLRVGIHTGPVFSNQTNNKKRLEIWGDTVNIASRMEASGQIGKVNITGMTYELVKDYFLCHYWGKMPVKYKGEIDMYFIEGFRPNLSVDGIGIKPNNTFVTRLGLIRFDDLEEFVMNILEEKLPKNLYYHNLKHTIDVTVQVEIIGRHEEITEEELLILKTAALFHDTGFTRTYRNHEEAGVEIAREILPSYDYTEEQIDHICRLIMKTKLPPKPVTLLEQIICDADLDYLGRVDFIPVSGNLFRELTEHQIIEHDINKWNQMQISFIENHQYFTESAKRMRDVNKNNQLEAIRRLVEENN